MDYKKAWQDHKHFIDSNIFWMQACIDTTQNEDIKEQYILKKQVLEKVMQLIKKAENK